MKKSFIVICIALAAFLPTAWSFFAGWSAPDHQKEVIPVFTKEDDPAMSAARKDFALLTAHYAGFAGLQIEAEYRLFQNENATRAYEISRVVSKKNADSYSYRLRELEQLANPRVSLLIDHDDKMMLLNKTRRPVAALMIGFELDSAFNTCSAVRVETQGHLRTYEFDTKFSEVERVRVTFDTNTFLLEKITLFYSEEKALEEGLPAEKPRLEICYLKQDTTPVFDASTFSELRFVRQQPDSVYKLLPAYATYQLLDYTR